jgi:hypothetical protein
MTSEDSEAPEIVRFPVKVAVVGGTYQPPEQEEP